MSQEQQYRWAGLFIAFLIGIVVPAFLLGPFLFGGIPLEMASTAAVAGSVGCAAFGIWLFLVSVMTEDAVVAKVLEPFEGQEAVIFFLPYMLYLGTKGIWQRLCESGR
jgi:hypothetical protein